MEEIKWNTRSSIEESTLADARIPDADSMPDHLVGVPGGPWALWRWVGLRGAGFPATDVLRLASPECAVAADELLDAEETLDRVRQAAAESINAALDDLRSKSAWDDREKRDPLLKAIRKIKENKIPQASLPAPIRDSVQALKSATEQSSSARYEFISKFEAGMARVSQTICEVAGADRFREAVIWQNRRAYLTGVANLGKKPERSRGSKQRQYEELVASYVQRYAVKNDTIGFFGPVGWARIVSERESLVARPGQNLLAERQVYFESWCIDALAERISMLEAARPWGAPRLPAYARVEKTVLDLGGGRLTRLSEKQAAVLRECDGVRSAKEIATALVEAQLVGIRTEEEVYEILKRLAELGWVIWALEVHIDSYPEKVLGERIKGIGDESVRRFAREALGQLERSRERVARAAGDPEGLDAALGELESTFTRLTGKEPTRGHGETYAARTLVFEDCRRDIEVEIGSNVLNALGPPLSLLLTSARWITTQIAQNYRAAFKEAYNELVRRTGSPMVSTTTFWHQITPLLFGDIKPQVESAERAFQALWADVLSIPEAGRRVQYSSDELKQRALAAFDADQPGWVGARYHSPDVMIVARDAEAIARGDYMFVMGELHLALNTLGASLFIEQHPVKSELLNAYAEDFPEQRLMPVMPKSWPNANLRTRQALASDKDVFVSLGHDSVQRPRAGAVPIADLLIEDTSDGLILRSADGQIAFEIIEALSELLSTLAVNSLKILSPGEHTPRVAIDRLVICRETWRFSPQDLEFAYEKEEGDRFLGARRWARAHDIPRFVFVKVPVETKPCYLDFDSPVYVNLFAKMIRRTQESAPDDAVVTLSEMLPGVDETWLPDAEGNRYTSELRLVALDMVGRAS